MKSRNIQHFGKDLAEQQKKEKTPIYKHVGHRVKCEDTFLGWAVVCDDCQEFVAFEKEEGSK